MEACTCTHWPLATGMHSKDTAVLHAEVECVKMHFPCACMTLLMTKWQDQSPLTVSRQILHAVEAICMPKPLQGAQASNQSMSPTIVPSTLLETCITTRQQSRWSGTND